MGRNVRRSNLSCSKRCSDVPVSGGEYEEYDDWQYKVRSFLNSVNYSLKKVTYLERLDNEIDDEAIPD